MISASTRVAVLICRFAALVGQQAGWNLFSD
jgi:hypothetical protein